MKNEVQIKSDIITWAIARAGFDLQEFLIKYPKVSAWIDNKKNPTIRQLEDFSKKVYLPFGYLFLNEPPRENFPISFFRTGKGETKDVSINVRDTVLLLKKRQEWLSEFLENNDYAKLDFVGKYNENDSHQEIVKDIRKTLNLKEDWAKSFKTWDETLNYFVKRMEDVRIITSFNGVVNNSNRRAISVEECRGFVLVDKFVPFLFVNNKDAKSAQVFTIAHELAHIWLGKSAGFDLSGLMPNDDPLELLCDRVAAEFLVPSLLFKDHWNIESNLEKNITDLGKQFKVSPIVIGRRALEMKLINKKDFFSFYNTYIKSLNKVQKVKASGGNPYFTMKKRVSLKFVAFVNSALKQNLLTYKDAYKLTSMKGSTYSKFINKFDL